MRRATDLHRLAYDLHQVRAVDLIAMALGYGVLLALFVGSAVSLLDWIDGRPQQAWQQVHALLVWIDGGSAR